MRGARLLYANLLAKKNVESLAPLGEMKGPADEICTIWVVSHADTNAPRTESRFRTVCRIVLECPLDPRAGRDALIRGV